jgi:hypothetical protein
VRIIPTSPRVIPGKIGGIIRDLEGIASSVNGDQKKDGTDVQDVLLRALIEEINRGCDTIAGVNDVTYRRVANGTGSVGAQFRHNLDFALSLLDGIEHGRIDYSMRERDPDVEIARLYAIGRFRKVLAKLRFLDSRILGKSVLVRSELDASQWQPSSVAREVEFIHSHTVHHHALIAEKLAGFGIQPPKGLGVAPSTLEYWASRAA